MTSVDFSSSLLTLAVARANLLTCRDVEPFVSQVSSQPGSLDEAATALNLFQDEVAEYLTRFAAAVCTDLQDLLLIDFALFSAPPQIRSIDLDIPSVGSNSSFTVDIFLAAESLPLGTHILSWAPLTDGTSLDDMILQFFVPEAGTLRITGSNPSGGAINPDTITFQFISIQVEDNA